MAKSKKIAHVMVSHCVACGTCVGACKPKAIQIYKGMRAEVDKEKCVGCGKCAKLCPAQIIEIVERRDA